MKRFAFLLSFFIALFSPALAFAQTDFPNLHLPEIRKEHQGIELKPPVHAFKIKPNVTVTTPYGYAPSQIRAAYNLPSSSGSGTVAIVDAYDNPNAEKDLATFDTQFGLASCTTANKCFTKHKMSNFVSSNSGWALEESLDVQWAHAIAPTAKVLLVEARSSRIGDLLNAVAYAKTQPGVVAVSMSWGAGEFSGSNTYDSYFNQPGVTFFASSGDSGTGVQWPAVSVNVVGVGGTTLNMSGSTFLSETAWNGSGGGISSFIAEPSYQTTFGVLSNNFRAVPDVSFDADPNTGVSVYDSFGYSTQRGWFEVGGTSVGAPSWAGLKALSHNVTDQSVYSDGKANYANFFRDITTGSNGSCGVVCTATTGYDFITGLGSPITAGF